MDTQHDFQTIELFEKHNNAKILYSIGLQLRNKQKVLDLTSFIKIFPIFSDPLFVRTIIVGYVKNQLFLPIVTLSLSYYNESNNDRNETNNALLLTHYHTFNSITLKEQHDNIFLTAELNLLQSLFTFCRDQNITQLHSRAENKRFKHDRWEYTTNNDEYIIQMVHT